MATSTNYGWAEPDNTSLVRDGAQAIRTLGDAIDTSLWNSGYGQAAKNKFINGDFSINQRAFTSTTTSGTYGFDRWLLATVDGTATYTPQTFTPGAAPVAGYEGSTFARIVTTGQTLTSAQTSLVQRIESVRTFAGQTITLSFWAKANTGTPKISAEFRQGFGTGGSPSATVSVPAGAVTISTSWARYSLTIAIPSISGKTIGTANDNLLSCALFVSAGTDLNTRASSIGIQSNTFELWGVQAEYGSKATPFQTASGGNIQNELAMCQRYYWRNSATQVYAAFFSGTGVNTTSVQGALQLPVTMRVSPSSVDYSTLAIGDNSAAATFTSLALVTNQSSTQQAWITVTGSGFTQYRTFFIYSNNSTSGYIGVSAEL